MNKNQPGFFRIPAGADDANSLADSTAAHHFDSVATDQTEDGRSQDISQFHVVILNNYLRPHHVVAFQELSQQVKRLTVLLSVAMEPDRDWNAAWEGLDVRVQKNWMLTRIWKHSNGFREKNFIHIPLDTVAQLKSLSPDIVFSYEMGFRTLLASRFRRSNPNVPLVMVGNMSEQIERERGMKRRLLRRIICKRVDALTYNGPSNRRYLQSLSFDNDRLFHLPYCIDLSTVFQGKRLPSTESAIRLCYCGALSQRKGVLQFARSLNQWCQHHPDQPVEFTIAGEGALADSIQQVASPSLSIKLLGNCNNRQLRKLYGNTDICVFPTLADEWGLVPIEAMASSVPVLGSQFAQSVEACVDEGKNGWVFDPTDTVSVTAGIERALKCTRRQLQEMGQAAKVSVEHIRPENTAESFCDIIRKLIYNG